MVWIYYNIVLVFKASQTTLTETQAMNNYTFSPILKYKAKNKVTTHSLLHAPFLR